MKKTSVIISLIVVLAVFLTVLASCDTNTSHKKPEPSGQGGYDIEITTTEPSTRISQSVNLPSVYTFAPLSKYFIILS